MSVLNVSDAEFDTKVMQSSVPVLVDFWAEWCGPCRVIAPALESIAEKLAGQLVVAKVNVDQNPSTPSRFGVRGIPMLVLLKDGQVVSTKVGASPESEIQSWVSDHLSL